MDPSNSQHSGLLVKRPFKGKWDEYQSDIDDAAAQFGTDKGLSTTIANEGSKKLRLEQLHEAVQALLAEAALPEPVSEQIYSDACALGKIVGSLVPSARKLVIKLEMFGASSCSRWHRDNYVARAIVSYTGIAGTEYTRSDNIDFWELKHGGNNERIVQDKSKVCAVHTGDFLLIKGTNYPEGITGLVHKSPDSSHHTDGRIVNRLVLKVDVPEFGDWEFDRS